MTVQNETTAAIAEGMLAEFEPELATTRRFLEAVPDDRLDWRPHEKSLSVGQLALHIAEIPRGVLELALRESASPPVVDFEQPESSADILAQLDRSAAFVRETLPGVSDEAMQEMFSIAKDGVVLLSVPRVSFLRSVMFNHWYHHRGQLGVYLRLLGATVPSSYGPSGDVSPF